MTLFWIKSVYPRIFLFIQVLYLWAYRHQAYRHRKSLTPEFLISKVLLRQRAGYVSKDVWNEMDKIVRIDLPSHQENSEKSDTASEFVQTKKHHVTDASDCKTYLTFPGNN